MVNVAVFNGRDLFAETRHDFYDLPVFKESLQNQISIKIFTGPEIKKRFPSVAPCPWQQGLHRFGDFLFTVGMRLILMLEKSSNIVFQWMMDSILKDFCNF